MIKNLNLVFSVITAFAAITALILTCMQIKLSNKQHLFDKRVENYLIATGLIQLYRINCKHLNHEKDNPIFTIELEFAWLTNNTYLEQITPAIKNPLKEPSHKELLIKLENLNDVETKIKFLFSGKASILLGNFILRYEELLSEMYKYQIIVNSMQKSAEDFKLTREKAQQNVSEKKYRTKLQEAFDNLKQADIALREENVEEQINKQIKLL